MLIRYTHGRPQTLFQGRAKFSRGRGAKTYYLPKKCPKTYNFLSKKSYNILFWAGQGGARDPSCPPLRAPMVTLGGKGGLTKFRVSSRARSRCILSNKFHNLNPCKRLFLIVMSHGGQKMSKNSVKYWLNGSQD